MSAAVEVLNLGFQYRRGRRHRPAVRNHSWSVPEGEIVGVIGPNGSGKSTLLKLLGGELRPSSGEARIHGRASHLVSARAVVGLATDPPAIPKLVTGREWLDYWARYRSADISRRRIRIEEAYLLGGLHEFVHRPVSCYSRGMLQRLAIAAAALAGTRVILLDESLSGLDPLITRQVREGLYELAGWGRTIFLASHDLTTIERAASRVLVLSAGCVRADVSMSTLGGQRIADLRLPRPREDALRALLNLYPESRRTGSGVSVVLAGGNSFESLMARCREFRIVVAGSRLRSRSLEDLLGQLSHSDEVRCGS